MTTLPRVTVVTPSFNQGDFLEATIESVLTQDYPNIEYMVVDGGSTDRSVEIIRQYADRLAYWISERDSGQSSAINKGWRRGTGDIFAFLNSDDTYLPGAIRTAVEFLNAHPDAGIAYGDCLAIDEKGATIEKYDARFREFDIGTVMYTCRAPFPQPAAFIRADVVHRIGLMDESLQYAMDYDYWLRAGLHYRLAYIPATLATYRLHPASKSVSRGVLNGPEIIRIHQRLLELPDFPESLRRNRRRVLCAAYLRAADEYYAAVQLPHARAMWMRAWALYPAAFGVREYLGVVNTWMYPLRRRLRMKRTIAS